MYKTFLHGYTVKKKDLFDNNSIISATAKSYISISYQKDLFSKDTRIFTASTGPWFSLPDSRPTPEPLSESRKLRHCGW